jgi:hypothetical protein
MFEFDFLGLGKSEIAGDIGKRLLSKDDCTWAHCPNRADEMHIFDGLGKQLQSAAILLEKSDSGPVDAAFDKQFDQSFMSQARRKWKLTLRYVKRRLRIT